MARTKEEQELYERAFEEARERRRGQHEQIVNRTQELLAQRVAREEQARMNAAVQQEPTVSQVQNEAQWSDGIMLPGTFGTETQNMYSRAFEAPDIAQQTRTQPKSQYEQMNAVKQAWDASDPAATERVLAAMRSSQTVQERQQAQRQKNMLMGWTLPGQEDAQLYMEKQAADKELADSLAALSQSTGVDEQTLLNWAERLQNPTELEKEMEYYRQNEEAMNALDQSGQAAVRQAAQDQQTAKWQEFANAMNAAVYGIQPGMEQQLALYEKQKSAAQQLNSAAQQLEVSPESLENYAQRLNNAETMEKLVEESRELGAEHPVLSSAGSVVTGVLGRVPSAIDYGAQYLRGKLGDEYLPVDTNTPFQMLPRATQEIRGQVSGDLEEAVQDATGSEGLGSAASLVYSAGLSGVDSIAQAALLGGNPILVGIGAGAGAFSDTVTSAKEKGASDSQAMAAGVASGIAESLFEQISLGNLKAMAKVNPKGLRDVVLNFGKSLAVEGSEEAMTEAANIVADAIIMGDVSDYNIAKNAWMEAGSREDEAEKQALKELIVRVAMAGAGGMIMGAGTSGAGMAYSGLRNVLSAQNSRGTSGADSLLPPLPQNEAQTEPVRVGRNTTIQRPYQGKTPAVRTNANYPHVAVPDSALNQARAQIEVAQKQTETGKGFKKSLKDFYRQALSGLFNGRTVTVENASFEGLPYDVTLNNQVISKVVSDPNMSAEKLAVLNSVEEVVKNAEYVGSGAYQPHGTKTKNVTRYDYFETQADIGGQEYTVSFDVEVIPGVNKYRTHKVIKNIELNPANGVEARSRTGRAAAESTLYTHSISQAAQKTSQDAVFLPPLPQNAAQTPGVSHQAARQRALEEARVTEEELSAIERMASATGLNVEYVYDTASGVDGFIQGNTITVNLASDSASFGTAVHEILHSMRQANEEQYVKFQNAVLRMAEQDAALSDYANKVRSMYTAQNSPALQSLLNEDGTVNSAALEEEVTLKLAEQIVRDPQKLTEAVSGDRGLMATFLDFVRGIKNSIAIKLTNSQKAMLDEAERTLVNLLRGEAGNVDGTRYSYIGEGAQLTSLQQSTLETAKQLEQSGEDAEAIRRKTGWFRSMDGKWRTELDDSTARLNWSVEDGEARLGDVLEHPALFRAHPELAEVRLRTGKLPDRVRGKYAPQSNTILLNEKLAGQPESVLLHEIQHAIQKSEGFAKGSSTENGKWHVLLDAYRQVKDTPQYQQLQTPDERREYVSEQIVQMGMPLLRQAARERYRRAAGETEARDTANRADYSAAQRALTRPDLRGEARYSEEVWPQIVDMLREMGYSESKIQEMMRGFQNGTEESRGAEEFGNLRGRTEADGRIGRRYHSAGARERGRGIQETYRTVRHSGSRLGGITQGAEQDSGQTFERESLNIPYSLPDGRSLREYLNEQYRGEPITWTNATTGKRMQMVQTENGAAFPPTNAEEPAAAVPGAMTEEAVQSKVTDHMQSTEQEDAAWEQYMPNGWQNLPIEQQIALSERAQKRAEQAAQSRAVRTQAMDAAEKENEDIHQILSVRLQLPQAVSDDTLVSNDSIQNQQENASGTGESPADAAPVNQAERDPRELPEVKAVLEDENAPQGKPVEVDFELAAALGNKGVNYSKDLGRNLDAAAGGNKKAREWLRGLVEKPFYEAKKRYAQSMVKNLDRYKQAMDELGIRPGSRESKAVMWYGEGRRKVKGNEYESYSIAELRNEFPNSWEKIQKADEVNRKLYNEYIDRINSVLDEIYPQVMEKAQAKLDKLEANLDYYRKQLSEATDQKEIERMQRNVQLTRGEVNALRAQIESGDVLRNKRLIPRQNYYHHVQEISQGFSKLAQILSTPTDISTNLVGVSDFTKPKSRWAGFMQQREGGFNYSEDSIAAMVDYMKDAEYKVNIDPIIARNRNIIKGLAEQTKNTRNANKFIEWMTDWTNDLAGKTNPIDRALQKITDRKSMQALRWLNNRVKANAVVGNLNSAVSQFFNLPNAAAYIKNPADWAQGAAIYMGDLVGDTKSRNALNQSGFLLERYGVDKAEAAFDTGVLKAPAKFANWLLTFGDQQMSKLIWSSAYTQGLRKGEADPVQYADDITRRSVAGRGVGEVPLTQKSEIVKLLAPFQVEVNNSWQLLKERVHEKDAAGLLLIFLASWLMNGISEKITGNRVVFDPIDAAMDGVKNAKEEAESEGRDAQAGDYVTSVGGRLLGETLSAMPMGSQIATNLLGLDSALGFNSEKFFGDSDPTRYGTGNVGLSALTKPALEYLMAEDKSKVNLLDDAMNLLPPFGGKQIARTIGAAQDMGFLPDGPFGLPIGNDAEQAPGSYTASGNLRFPIDTTDPVNVAAGLMFGSYGTKEGKEYIQNGAQAKGSKYTQAYRNALQNNISGEQFDEWWNRMDLNADGQVTEKEAVTSLPHLNGVADSTKAFLWSQTAGDTSLEGYRAAQDNGVGNEYFQMRMEADQDKPGESGYGSISSTEMKDWLRRQELGLDKQAALWKTMATYDQQYDYATAQRQGVGDLYVDLLLNADQLYGDGNGYLNKAEIMAYLDAAQLELDVKRLLFGMVSSAKNPY